MKKESVIVVKFGGTSVSTKSNIQTIVNVVKKEKKIHDVVLVVSALSGITDLFLLTATGKKDSIKSIKEKHYNLITDLWKDQRRERSPEGSIACSPQ